MPAVATRKTRARRRVAGGKDGSAPAPGLPAGGPSARAVAEIPEAELLHITPALRALAVPIDSVKLDSRNARVHGERNRRSINYSLKRFGQQKTISVDADGVILAGNGTWVEGKALGWKYIAVGRSHLRGAEARAYALSDNRTSELSSWDAEELTATLDEIGDVDEELRAGLEFSDDEVDKLLNDAQAAVEQPESQGQGSGSGSGAIREQFKTVIDHASEDEQAAFLQRMKAEGRKVRALIA